MIERKTKLQKIEIVGQNVQLKYSHWIEEDGLVIGEKTNTRRVIQPEDDISSEDQKIQQICQIARED